MTYVHGNLLYWETGILDGNALRLTDPWRSVIDAGLWLVLATLAWRFRQWLFLNGWKVCSALLVFQAIGVVAQSGKNTIKPEPFQDIPAEAVEFSVQGNVIHIVLDAFQASIFEHILNEDPALEAELSGFTFFRDAVTSSDVTYLSVPASLSGVAFTNESTISDYLRKTLEGVNLYSFLAENGFGVDVVTPVWWNQPNSLFSSYYRLPTPYANLEDRLQSSALLLTDLSLFRQVPYFLKSYVYGNGVWMFSNWLVREPEQQFEHFAHNRFFQDFTGRSTVDSDLPRYKFFHLVTPHAPLVVDRNCEFTGEALSYSLDSASAQSRCTLSNVISFLRRLKALGIYKQSLILIHGDHGGGIAFEMKNIDGTLTSSSEALYRIWGNPLPLLLVKPPGAKGVLKVSNKAVGLVDIPATVADLLGLEHAFTGESTFTGATDPPRPRHYYRSTIHRNEAAAKDRFDNFSNFVIRGSIYDVAAWSEEERYEAPALNGEGSYVWGTPLSFGLSGTFRPFQQGGWSPSRKANLTWTNGKEAAFSIPLPRTSKPVTMRIKVKPYIVEGKLEVQKVTLQVGSNELNPLNITERTFRTYEIQIPAAFLNTESDTVFTFQLPDAQTPSSMGTGRDLRALALAFASLQFDQVP